MEFLRNKKGSHVTVILSMVLFVSFVIFIILIIQPGLNKNESKNFLVSSLKVHITEQISSDLKTIIVSEDADVECTHLSEDFLLGSSYYVRNSEGNSVNFYADEGIYVSTSSGNPFYKIYCSNEEFTDYSSTPSCGAFESTEVENVQTDVKIFESKVENLSAYYELNYEELKSLLSFPETSDFVFSFDLGNGTVIGPSSIGEVSTDVFIKRFPVQYVSREAQLKYGSLIIEVW